MGNDGKRFSWWWVVVAGGSLSAHLLFLVVWLLGVFRSFFEGPILASISAFSVAYCSEVLF
jgi:hypothetical protein